MVKKQSKHIKERDEDWEQAWEQIEEDVPVIELTNLGPKCEQWLASINIHTRSDLEERGILDAYLMIAERYDGINVNLLYAMYGAMEGIGFSMVGPGQRQRLKDQLASRLKTWDETSGLT